MKFIVVHGILSRGYYDTIQDAQANLYDKKGHQGTIKVEISEEEYRAVVGEINGLRDRVNNITADSQRQLQSYKIQCETKLREMADKHQREMEPMNRRVEGLRNAIRKWRIKAKVEEPGELDIIAAERKIVRKKGKKEWQYIEQWKIPVEKNPALAREAWAWLDEREKTQYVERLYFHEKHQCWVAAIRAQW